MTTLLKPLKSIAKAVISPLVDLTGIYERRIRQASGAPGCWTIVMYHRVIDDPALDPFRLGMCVSRAKFENQINYLRSSFNVIGVGEANRRIAAGVPLPDRALSVTFDDGYLDNLTTAVPIMERLGVPFTVFVPTGALESGEMLWWDRAIAALTATTKPSIDLQDAGLSDRAEELPLKGLKRYATVDRILDRLWSLEMEANAESVRRLEAILAPKGAAHLMAHRLTPAQVVELRRRGVEIGAHSVHHPNLGLASPELARQQMVESRTYLEELLQEGVPGFAYPGGRMRSDTATIARQVGFEYALSTEVSINRPPFDPFRLKRIGMPDANLPDFRRALSNALVRTASEPKLRF